MINFLIKNLDNYWDVSKHPKADLSRLPDELPLKTSNWIVMTITIFLFTITVVFIGAGML